MVQEGAKMANLILWVRKPSHSKMVILGYIFIFLFVSSIPSVGMVRAQIMYAPPVIIPTLKNVIDTSIWLPPSPDPTGIAYWRAKNSLVVTDSEVEAMPGLFTGFNIFESSPGGTLMSTGSTLEYSNEPSGLGFNASIGHFYIADDDLERIFEIHPGNDGILGTDDDLITSFDTSAFGCNDPEGVAFGDGELFIADGVGAEIFKVNPGVNKIFDGVPPAGDDFVSQFDTFALGISDPQGIEFNPVSQTLFFTGGESDYVVESDKQGVVLRLIDISALNIVSASGLALGRLSGGAHTSSSLYISDRGVDEDVDPSENDGKIYEIVFEGLNLFGQYLPILIQK
jgi:DNA-binding beta-propeller fold protein YncE